MPFANRAVIAKQFNLQETGGEMLARGSQSLNNYRKRDDQYVVVTAINTKVFLLATRGRFTNSALFLRNTQAYPVTSRMSGVNTAALSRIQPVFLSTLCFTHNYILKAKIYLQYILYTTLLKCALIPVHFCTYKKTKRLK